MNPTYKMILIVTITALVASGGTYYFVNNKANTDKAMLQSNVDSLQEDVTALTKKVAELTPTTTTTTTPSTATTTTPDPTADWKTYTNATYKFSFKYPTNWTVVNKGQIGTTTTIYDMLVATPSTNVVKGEASTFFWTMGVSKATVDETVNAFRGDGTQVTITDITKFGVAVKQLEIRGPKNSHYLVYVLASPTSGYTLHVQGKNFVSDIDGVNDDLNKIAEQIIDTFAITK